MATSLAVSRVAHVFPLGREREGHKALSLRGSSSNAKAKAKAYLGNSDISVQIIGKCILLS